MPTNFRTTAEVERWKRAQILKPQARAADAVKVDDARAVEAGGGRHHERAGAAVRRGGLRPERPRQRRRAAR